MHNRSALSFSHSAHERERFGVPALIRTSMARLSALSPAIVGLINSRVRF